MTTPRRKPTGGYHLHPRLDWQLQSDRRRRQRLTRAMVIEILRHQIAQLEADKADLMDRNADLRHQLEIALDENEQLKWMTAPDRDGNITSIADQWDDWQSRYPEEFE